VYLSTSSVKPAVIETSAVNDTNEIREKIKVKRRKVVFNTGWNLDH
jgi:hypothetical protein